MTIYVCSLEQGVLVPQLPADEGPAPEESPEEAIERLAHLEQLVVQLKELIRDKDAQLFNKDAQLRVNDLNFNLFKKNKNNNNCQPMLCVLRIHRTRKRKPRLASPSSNCKPKPRW